MELPLKQPESIGVPSKIVPRNVIATVLDIAAVAWGNVKSKRLVTARSHEPDIAGSLGSEMVLEKQRRPGVANQIRIEEEVGTRSAVRPTKTDGRIDIKIIYSFNEAEYFGIECKRVAGGSGRATARLSKLYVEQGVMRFVNAKYSVHHDVAALLGIVLRGSTNECVAHIRPHLASSNIVVDWNETKEFSVPYDVFTTTHRQQVTDSLLKLLHLFFHF